jgi:hypothetical protein
MNRCPILAIVWLTLTAACSPMVYTHGVPNLANVSENVWRSGQISTAEGWDTIASLSHGRTIHVVKLNFDNEGTDTIAIQRGYDVQTFAIDPRGDTDLWDEMLSAWRRPDESRVSGALAILRRCKLHPDTDFCLVHCTHGQDRTGYIIGEYRVGEDGWPKARAYAEMLAHHFHAELHGLHEAWESFTGKP